MKTSIMIAALFLLAASCFAQSTVRDAIDGYYAAAKAEQIDSYMGCMDTSQMSEGDIQATRDLTLGIWNAYDTDSYAISDYKSHIEGDYALATYRMDAQISGRETLENNLDYIAFLHKIGGNWKIVFVMPLAEYLESSAEIQALKVVDDAVDEQHTLYTSQQEHRAVLFDREPMGNLSSEIGSSVGDCTTNNYCASHGLGECRDGECTMAAAGTAAGSATSAPGEGNGPGSGEGGSCCGTAFILLVVPVLAVVFRSG